MDIIYYLLIIGVIGLFFFLNQFVKSFNPMIFALVFCLIGLMVSIQSAPTIDTGVIEYNYTYTINNTLDSVIETPIEQSFTLYGTWTLIFIGLIFVCIGNIFLSNKEGEKQT